MSEEIEQEIEVLRAIYQDELSGSAATGLILDVRPTPGSEEHCELKLTFTIPKTYPQAAPTVTATPVKGVTVDEANKLLAILKNTAAENIGQQMVFTLASAAKEWLDDLNVHYDERHKKAQEVEAAREAEKEAAAARARERARGTPVTRATFLAWNAKFQEELRQKEMAAAKEAAAVAAAAGLDKEKKLTGRALFESDASLVMSDAALLETFKNEPLPADVAVPAALLADPDSAALFDDAGLDDDVNDVAPSPSPAEVEAASK